MRPWQISVDTGGTFTDCIALDPAGREHRRKVLSSAALRGEWIGKVDAWTLRLADNWQAPGDFVRGFVFRPLGSSEFEAEVVGFDPEACSVRLDRPLPADWPVRGAFEVASPYEAPVLAARLVTGVGPEQALPPVRFRLATTRGTNALLERKGGRVALVTNRGLEDLPQIGTQQRPDIFAREILKPLPIHSMVFGLSARMDASGTELVPLDRAELEALAEQLAVEEIEAVAVALMHSYRNPAHEQAVEAFLEECGLRYVSASSGLAEGIKLLVREQTAIVDACLSPVLNRYLDRVADGVGEANLSVLTSAGGLSAREDFHPKDGLLSGPAGGVVGSSSAGRQLGFEKTIAFDMGGTSTDVSRFDGDFDYRFEHAVGDVRVMAPALRIETVAAGGGSLCGFDGEGLFVGPESAGAFPGPACYGAGGPLTITDVNALLGRLDPEHFAIPIDLAAARTRLAELEQSLERAGHGFASSQGLLNGFLEIANERMAGAIHKISAAEGYDPADYTLVAFGGAGGQHACAIAGRLGISRVVCPANAGLLSADGLGKAVVERFAQRRLVVPLTTVVDTLPALLEDLVREAAAGIEGGGEVRRRILELRLSGQEAVVQVDWPEDGAIAAAFEARYKSIFGYSPADAEVELITLRVVVSEPRDMQAREAFSAGGELPPGVVQDQFSTVVIEPGWSGKRGARGTLLLTRDTQSVAVGDTEARADLVAGQLFINRIATLIDECGKQLERTAVSTNVKERLDFSCALLDSAGRLLVNAPHVPVHLGALGVCVRAVVKALPMREGDVVVTNHPGFGGSHLPDVTVITPVFLGQAHPVAYLANRAHHAEIGGRSPGSMPPDARSLAEEGVIISPTYLFEQGVACYERVAAHLQEGPYPSRQVADNIADLKAQAAANVLGVRRLEELSGQYPPAAMARYFARLHQTSASALRARMERGVNRSGCQKLDDGSVIRVAIRTTDDRMRISFAGTSPRHPGNFNATPAIVQSAVLYVLRLLVNEPVPLNEGVFEVVDIDLPGCFLNPGFTGDANTLPAVVAGNTETSQRVVDTLIQAFDLMACGQGTMNNLVFGNARCSYYETICGGAGAGNGFAGADAVHTHMTNTAITDPEVLESRYPVRLEEFSIRSGSGGDGRWSGGAGVVRKLRFLEPCTLSLLTQHRVEAPFGQAGGAAGVCGRQRVVRANGQILLLPAVGGVEMADGDLLVVETPGGGGYGQSARSRDRS